MASMEISSSKLARALLTTLGLLCVSRPVGGESQGDFVAAQLRCIAVKVSARMSEGPDQDGWGIGFAQERTPGGKFWIVTPNHVVRSDHGTTTSVRVEFFPDSERHDAILLPYRDIEADIAVLETHAASQRGESRCQQPPVYSPEATTGDAVWLVARDGDWNPVRVPGRLSRVTPQLEVDGLRVFSGDSGGPLVSDVGIVGMIVRDNANYVIATPIETIRRIVSQQWHLPWDLLRAPAGRGQPGPGAPAMIDLRGWWTTVPADHMRQLRIFLERRGPSEYECTIYGLSTGSPRVSRGEVIGDVFEVRGPGWTITLKVGVDRMRGEVATADRPPVQTEWIRLAN
jgi:hypothetical protein